MSINSSVRMDFLKDITLFTVPDYIQKLLSYCGYDNEFSISMMDEEDIKRMELFARDTLSKLLEGEEFDEFFGIYSSRVDLFAIPDGHKKILRSLQKECAKIVAEKESEGQGLEQSLVQILNSGASETGRRNTQTKTQTIKPAYNQPSQCENQGSENSQEEKSSTNKEKQKAEEHIRNVVKKNIQTFCSNEVDASKKQEALNNLDQVKVDVNFENFNAKIKCCLCSFVSTAYSVKNSKFGRKWVTSNFTKHFKIHFKKSDKDEQHKKKKNVAAATVTQTSLLRNFLITDASIEKDFHSTQVPSISVESSSQVQDQASAIDENQMEHDSTGDSNPTTLSSHHPEAPSEAESETLNVALGAEPGSFEAVSRDDVFFVSSRTNEEAVSSAGFSKPQSCSTRSPKGDVYSRQQRNLRRLTGLMHNQRKITDFVQQVSDEIERNPSLHETLHSLATKTLRSNQGSNFRSEAATKVSTEVKSLLHYIQSAASENSKRKSHANLFCDPLKRFSLYIFIIGGRLLYETLYANMKNALPSITTLNRLLDKSADLAEGVVRMSELHSYLSNRNYPLRVFVSEDQTALVRRIQYDPKTNKMVGFVGRLCQKTGFPLTEEFEVNSVQDIEIAFKEQNIANNAYVYMAQPLVEGSPAFCLAIFASDNKFCYNDVLKRWSFIEEQAKEYGITIEGYASDGDTRCLKAMKVLSKIPHEFPNPYGPCFQTEYSLEKGTVIQDTVHVGTKLKTRLLNPKTALYMGDKLVSSSHIETLMDKYSKDEHLLCRSFLQSADKMNYEAIDKLCAVRVTNLLEGIPESEATRQYLILTRYILDAFLEKNLPIEKRIYYMWYSTFFLRLWRQWVSESKLTMQKNFITLNTYTCIELNAHGLLLLLDKCANRESNSFFPWLCSSQPCEKIFRQTRSMTSTNSTVVNYSFLDIKRRLCRIQAINDITADLTSDPSNTICFPRENTGKLGCSTISYNESSSQTLEPSPGDLLHFSSFPSLEEIKILLEKCKTDATNDAYRLGMTLTSAVNCFEHISIPTSIQPEREGEKEGEEKEEEEEDEEEEEQQQQPQQQQQEFSDVEASDDEAMEEIREEISLFKSYDSLNFKNYSNSSDGVSKNCLKVVLNGSETVVRKSSLCWFFSDRSSLSSDRLQRVKSMSGTGKKRQISQEKPEDGQTKETETERRSEKKKSTTRNCMKKMKMERAGKREMCGKSKSKEDEETDLESGSSLDDEVPYQESSDSPEDFDVFDEKQSLMKMSEGDFIIVKVYGKTVKNFRHFVAKITEDIKNKGYVVTFLKRHNSTSRFSEEDESNFVSSDDVVYKLPPPITSSCARFANMISFPIDFANFNFRVF